jgi:hypothetical protein
MPNNQKSDLGSVPHFVIFRQGSRILHELQDCLALRWGANLVLFLKTLILTRL